MLHRTPEKTSRGLCGSGACPSVPKQAARRRWLLSKEIRSPRSGCSLVCGSIGTKQTALGRLRPARTCRVSEQATARRGLSIPPAAKETATALGLVLLRLRRTAKEAPTGRRLVLRWSSAEKVATRLTRVLRTRWGRIAAKEATTSLLGPGIGSSTKQTCTSLTRILRARRGGVAAKGTTARLLSPRGSAEKTWASTLTLRSTWLGAAEHRRLGARCACAGPSVGSRGQSTE